MHTLRTLAAHGRPPRFVLAVVVMALATAPLAGKCLPDDQDINPDLRPVLREQLKRAGLGVQWYAQLPLEGGQRLKTMWYDQDQLLALTANNVLYALDARRGTVAWTTILGPALATCSEPFFFQNRVLFSLGRQIVEVRRSDGEVLKRQSLKFNATTAPARSETRLFVGGDNNVFHCFNYENGVLDWFSHLPDMPTGNIALADGRVYFAGRDGNLYVSRVAERELIYQFRTFDAVPGFALDDGQCFVPSADTKLYGLDAATGRRLWDPYLAGGPLVTLPVVTDESVYQHVERRALVCIDRRTGLSRWELPQGRWLLTEAGRVIYCLTMQNEIVAIDSRNGAVLVTFFMPEYTVPAQNTQTRMVYLASPSGAVTALEPQAPIER